MMQSPSIDVADGTIYVGSTVFMFREHVIELAAFRVAAINYTEEGPTLTLEERVGTHAGHTHNNCTPAHYYSTPLAALDVRRAALERECANRVAVYAREAEKTVTMLALEKT
jgi:hypothetical protein